MQLVSACSNYSIILYDFLFLSIYNAIVLSDTTEFSTRIVTFGGNLFENLLQIAWFNSIAGTP